jgi:hypothetical protein
MFHVPEIPQSSALASESQILKEPGVWDSAAPLSRGSVTDAKGVKKGMRAAASHWPWRWSRHVWAGAGGGNCACGKASRLSRSSSSFCSDRMPLLCLACWNGSSLVQRALHKYKYRAPTEASYWDSRPLPRVCVTPIQLARWCRIRLRDDDVLYHSMTDGGYCYSANNRCLGRAGE